MRDFKSIFIFQPSPKSDLISTGGNTFSNLLPVADKHQACGQSSWDTDAAARQAEAEGCRVSSHGRGFCASFILQKACLVLLVVKQSKTHLLSLSNCFQSIIK